MIEFEQVLEQGRAAQGHFRDLALVAVGGTAAAVHCGHRISLDVDLVTPHLRDRYEEIAASTGLLGDTAALKALDYLNLVYPAAGLQSVVGRFAEPSEAQPLDLAETPLDAYKGLKAPFADWAYVAETCRRLARPLVKSELNNSLPQALDEGFYNESKQ